MYRIVNLLVDLDFLFHFAIGGLEPHLPLLPKPALTPLCFALFVEPHERGWVEDLVLCFATLIVCAVFFLQVGQYLFVSFGSLIFNS